MLKKTVRACFVLVLGLPLMPAQEALAGKNRVRVDLKSNQVKLRYQNQQARFLARQAQRMPRHERPPIETAFLEERTQEVRKPFLWVKQTGLDELERALIELAGPAVLHFIAPIAMYQRVDGTRL